MTEELAVCGLNAVLALGEYNPDNIKRLFIKEERMNLFGLLCKQLAEKKRPYKICDDNELEKICKSNHHQGIVAMIKYPDINVINQDDLDSWAQEGRTGVILHEVGNDHNLGLVARSAAFFDAPWIVVSGRNEEFRLTTSAYRMAEGGMEHVKVRTVNNTVSFLNSASKRLILIGTDVRARLRLKDLGSIIKNKTETLKFNGKPEGKRPGIAIVLGNEETGLPADIKDACTCIVRVSGTGLMNSLNVSAASALFLNEIYQL